MRFSPKAYFLNVSNSDLDECRCYGVCISFESRNIHMPLPTLIEDRERAWLFKTLTQSADPKLNACLIGFWLGSGMTTLELCRLQIKDVLAQSGQLTKSFVVRGEIERDFYLCNTRLLKLIKEYISVRPKDGDHPDQFCGFSPDEPFFKRKNGNAFKIKRRVTQNGNSTYHCNSLNNHIKRLLLDAGIERPSILSGRRTCAVKLRRCGVDTPTIHKLLGNKTLDTTLRLIETDTVSMTTIADMAF